MQLRFDVRFFTSERRFVLRSVLGLDCFSSFCCEEKGGREGKGRCFLLCLLDLMDARVKVAAGNVQWQSLLE